jgi:hypothetical protein
LGHGRDLSYVGLQHYDICDRDDLLLRCFEVAQLLSFAAEFLDCIHQLLGLVNESLAQLNGPGQILVHFGD